MNIERYVNAFILDATLFESVLREYSGIITEQQIEIRRTTRGACYLLKNMPLEQIEPFLRQQTGSYFIEEKNSFLSGRYGDTMVLTE